MTLIVALLGASFATGLCLMASGMHRSQRPPVSHTVPPDVKARAVRAAIAAAMLGIATRWPVAAVAAGAAGWWSPQLFGNRAGRDQAIARTEAIASWTEMLRDTMSGAHGLDETILTTAMISPEPIRDNVVALAARLEREPMGPSLRTFADDLSHPMGDLVVTALLLAADGSVRDLGELLGALAAAARDEAAMRLRVEAARARMRTAVRVIAVCTVVTAGGLVLLNRSYLDVYTGPLGQAVLALIAAGWGVSLWWLARMGEFATPERFLVASPTVGGEL